MRQQQKQHTSVHFENHGCVSVCVCYQLILKTHTLCKTASKLVAKGANHNIEMWNQVEVAEVNSPRYLNDVNCLLLMLFCWLVTPVGNPRQKNQRLALKLLWILRYKK